MSFLTHLSFVPNQSENQCMHAHGIRLLPVSCCEVCWSLRQLFQAAGRSEFMSLYLERVLKSGRVHRLMSQPVTLPTGLTQFCPNLRPGRLTWNLKITGL